MDLIKGFLKLLVRVFFVVYFFLFGKPKFGKGIQEALSLYRDSNDKFSELFQTIRLWDAPLEEVEKLVPKKGVVIDLGSGDGLLANYLGIKNKSRRIVGLELNEKRISESDKKLKNVIFKRSDILKEELPRADCFLLVHVLHHLNSPEDQEVLLDKIKSKLKKNGELIVVEIIKRPFFKYLFTLITDVITIPILFEGKFIDFNINYRSDGKWRRLFSEIGYKVTGVTYPHKGKPFSHVIIVCKKNENSN